MKIEQFFYGHDNLGYLLHADGQALAIDGGAVDPISAFVRDHDLTLTMVTNTHGHGDHTTGTQKLVKQSGARHLDHRQLGDGQTIALGDRQITVLHTPGHTTDSLTFAAGDFLVTGDTLFNATVGNCFSGDLKAFYRSIVRLLEYPDTTRIFAGHDYVTESLAVARQLMPDNAAIDAYAASYDKRHVVSTLAQERAVNPFLRFNEPEIIGLIESRGLPTETGLQRWEGIMAIG